MDEFIQDEFQGVASINNSLVGFEAKEVFRWHLSIMFDVQDVNEKKLPIGEEIEVFDRIEDEYNDLVVGVDIEKPNGLFLARIYWNETLELIWRLHDAEEFHTKLLDSLKNKGCPRPFDYRIDDDKEWKLAEWHLDVVG